mgnify:CR=1 FL=1
MIKKYLLGFLVMVFMVPALAFGQGLTFDKIVAAIGQNPDLANQLRTFLNQTNSNSSGSNSGSNSGTSDNCYTFNYTLKSGDFSPEVFRLHTFLRKEGFGYGVGLTNFYSPGISIAVSAFQNKYRNEILVPLGLSGPTGNFGEATRAQMNRLYGCNSGSGSGQSGTLNILPTRNVDFSVKKDGTSEMLANVVIQAKRGNSNVGTYITNTNGHAPMASLKTAENHSLTISLPGYETRTISNLIIPSGVGTYNYNISLRPDSTQDGDVSTSNQAPAIFVTNPTGGSYQAGQNVSVSWLINNSPINNPTVSIKLLNASGSTVDTEGASGTNDSESFSLSSSLSAGQYRFRVSATLSGQTREAWSSWFSVTNSTASDDDSDEDNDDSDDDSASTNTNATITITSPTTGAVWSNQTGHTVTWTTAGVGNPSLTMELLTAANQPASGFNSFVTANDYTESMSLQTVPPGFYFFRLKAVINGQTIYGGSGIFQLTGDSGSSGNSGGSGGSSGVTPTITIPTPANGAVWSNQTGHSITWSSTNLPAGQNLTMELLTAANQPASGFNAFVTSNDGYEAFSLSGISPGFYFFRLKAVVNGQNIYGGSGVFQLTN